MGWACGAGSMAEFGRGRGGRGGGGGDGGKQSRTRVARVKAAFVE